MIRSLWYGFWIHPNVAPGYILALKSESCMYFDLQSACIWLVCQWTMIAFSEDCGLIWIWTCIRIKTSWILNEWCQGFWILSAWILNELKHEFWGYVPWLGSWCFLIWGWCHSDAIWHECIVWHASWVHSDINSVCFLTQPLNIPGHGLWVQSAMASQGITAKILTA